MSLEDKGGLDTDARVTQKGGKVEVSARQGSPVATRKDLGGEGVGRIFPSFSGGGGGSPAAAASRTSGVQDWERVIFCCFMPPVCAALFRQPPNLHDPPAPHKHSQAGPSAGPLLTTRFPFLLCFSPGRAWACIPSFLETKALEPPPAFRTPLGLTPASRVPQFSTSCCPSCP